MSKEGENYGTTYQKSSPAISFPKTSTPPNYGKKLKVDGLYKGDQFGITRTKSNPAVDFPNSKPAFMSGSAAKRGY